MSFVKTSSGAADSKEEDEKQTQTSVGENNNDGKAGAKSKSSGKEGKATKGNEPGWLKDNKSRVPSTPRGKKSGADSDAMSKNDKKDDNEMDISDDDDDDENDVIDEAEMKLLDDQENRFKELLVKAGTSKNPLLFADKPIAKNAGIGNVMHQSVMPVDDEPMSQNSGIGFGGNNDFGREQASSGGAQSSGLGFVSGGGGIGSKPTTGGLGLGMASNGSSGIGHTSGMGLESESESAGLGPGLGIGGASGMGLGSDRGAGLGMGGMGLGSNQGLGSGMGSSGMGLGSNQGGMGSSGLGLGSSFPGFSQGGIGFSGLGSNGLPPKKKDPNLGKWEKHTKGIGMKLLSKMGYEGSGGLGAKRRRPPVGNAVSTADEKSNLEGASSNGQIPPTEMPSNEEVLIKKGISRPVEVVVRPHGLGLGFGNFKEQSQLKVNRQIEAEVRGLAPPKEESKKKDGKGEKSVFDGIDKSLLPSTESLLNRGAGSWRKGKGNKKAKRKIINYQDILNQSTADDGSKMKIIDMRGTSTVSKDATTGASDSSTPAAVQIGEELLHNVTLLLNTHEGQLRTSSYMVKSTEQKIVSLEKERKEIAERKEGMEIRKRKMKLALDVIGVVEDLIETMSSREKRKLNHIDKLAFAFASLQKIFVNLYKNLSREERKSLKFDVTLIPSILEPMLDSLTSALNPLKMDLSWMDHFAAGVQKLCDTVGSDDEAYVLRETIFMQSIVPWIQSSLSRSKWNPVENVEIGLRLYETLLNSAYKSFPGAEEDENAILKDSITYEIVQKTVMPKLLRAVSHWRPKMNDTQQISNPLHLWILPWLPHINSNSTLGTLLGDVRRNLKKTLSFLSKSVTNDVAFIRACISILFPWRRLFDDAAIFELTSTSVTPRFARSLARIKIGIRPANQDWEHLHVLIEYFEKGLMSGDDFVSLVEGEVLPSWVYALHSALKQKDHGMNDTKQFYLEWKMQLFGQCPNTHTKTPNPQLVLRSEPVICRYFFGGLKMIQAAMESNEAMLDSLVPPLPANCNYRISLMHRSKERKAQNGQPSAVNVRTQRKVHRNSRTEASFQEVVEAFANQHDITFHPKTGSNSMKDGKPVFLFGAHPVYFHKNVLFALRGTEWRPISLEHLAQAC